MKWGGYCSTKGTHGGSAEPTLHARVGYGCLAHCHATHTWLADLQACELRFSTKILAMPMWLLTMSPETSLEEIKWQALRNGEKVVYT